MVRAFICECGVDDFFVITENFEHTNNENKTFVRCTDCSKDYQIDEINSIE